MILDGADMRPKKPWLDRLIANVWYVSVNAKQYKSLSSSWYVWSIVRVFRVFSFLHQLMHGRPTVESFCNEFGLAAADDSLDSLLEDNEEKPTSKIDRSQLITQSANLFRLEVSLICQKNCQTEMYSLLAYDDVPINDLSDRLYYKSYYHASRSHGRIQLLLVRRCVSILHATHVSLRAVLSKRAVSVDFARHLDQLTRISDNLNLGNGSEKLQKGKHWESAGFQGDDPSTDFRGVGSLGLHLLDYFCQHHPLYAERMVTESGTLRADASSDIPWYPFALCSIHVTSLVCTLLESGVLQQHLLQGQLCGSTGVADFIDSFFSYVFIQCHLDWAEGVDKNEITSILQFEEFFRDFSQYLKGQLESKVWYNDDFHPQRRWWK